jgi:hypothetical protein
MSEEDEFDVWAGLRRDANRARSQAQALRNVVNELAERDKLVTDARLKELQAILDRGREVLPVTQLGDRRRTLEDDVAGETIGSAVGDVVQRLIDSLRAVEAEWPQSAESVSADRLKRLTSGLDQAILDCEVLTLPQRLREHLASVGVGRSLKFDELIEDETVNDAQRDYLLRWLTPYGHEFGVVIDVKARLIYKLSTNRRWRIISYFSPVIWGLLGAALLAGIGNLHRLDVVPPDKWNLSDASQLLGAYVLVLIGAIIHLVVENLKQAQAGTPVLAIDDFLAWLNLRWAGLVWTVALILVTVIGLRVSGVDSASGNIPIYIFAGYSFDSVAGLFLTRFGTAADKGVTRLRAQLGGGAET